MGKSTIFSAVTSAPAEAANYPFCTIEPNVGIVSLPDKRLDNLSALFHPKKTVPAIVEFVDSWQPRPEQRSLLKILLIFPHWGVLLYRN